MSVASFAKSSAFNGIIEFKDKASPGSVEKETKIHFHLERN